MLTFGLGALVAWVVTGTADYFATRRAAARAYELGVRDGVRQVSAW